VRRHLPKPDRLTLHRMPPTSSREAGGVSRDLPRRATTAGISSHVRKSSQCRFETSQMTGEQRGARRLAQGRSQPCGRPDTTRHRWAPGASSVRPGIRDRDHVAALALGAALGGLFSSGPLALLGEVAAAKEKGKKNKKKCKGATNAPAPTAPSAPRASAGNARRSIRSAIPMPPEIASATSRSRGRRTATRPLRKPLLPSATSAQTEPPVSPPISTS
jgi:hypothetical protein